MNKYKIIKSSRNCELLYGVQTNLTYEEFLNNSWIGEIFDILVEYDGAGDCYGGELEIKNEKNIHLDREIYSNDLFSLWTII